MLKQLFHPPKSDTPRIRVGKDYSLSVDRDELLRSEGFRKALAETKELAKRLRLQKQGK